MSKEPLDEPRWYAVHTGARQELVALTSLKRAGYWTFHAFERVRRARKRPGKTGNKVEWIDRAYFNRYVFTALRYVGETLDAIQPYNPNTGFGMEGISTVVRSPFSGEPLRIPTKQMDKIIRKAMVRFDGNPDEWLQVLMREIVLDEQREVRLFIDSQGKRRMLRLTHEVAKIA